VIWTLEQDATVLRMWEAGASAREIGAALGITRGAVIGRHRRLLLAGKTLAGVSEQLAAEQPAMIDMIVHPAWDPMNKLWFLEDLNVEAPSLAELLKKLPRGARVRDHYRR